MTVFTVTGASAGREFDVLSAAFTDGVSHVLLSRSIDPSEDDRRLGLAGLHVEFSDQAMSGYDLVSDIEWEGSTLRISMNTAGRAIGLPETLCLEAAGQHLDEDGRSIVGEMVEERVHPASSQGVETVEDGVKAGQEERPSGHAHMPGH